MNPQNNLSKTPARTRALVVIGCAALFGLSSCASKTEAIAEDESRLVKLPEWTQVAVVLEGPLTLFGVAAILWALNGGALITKTIVNAKKKDGDD
jgi:hypothetical protein